MRFVRVLFVVLFAAAALSVSRQQAAPIRFQAGAHSYEWVRGWGTLPGGKTLGNTHGCVVVDKQDRIYLCTDTEDAVVVFDRVRENLRKYKKMPLPELLNGAINQTLSRTVITGGTTLMAVLALYLLGGEVIRGFSFAILWGIVIGTYSSVCVASPLLLYLNISRGGKVAAGAAAEQSP